MGHKVDISEVSEFSGDLKTASAGIKSSLNSVEQSIDQVNAMSSFSGMTAKEAKNYFNDLHKTILESLNGLFTDLDEHVKNHLESFHSRVDASESAIIESDYLTDTEEDISDNYDQLSGEQESVRETIAGVSDISSANQPLSWTLDTDKDTASETITDLEEKLVSFTSEGSEQISEIEDLLHHIEKTINNAGAVTSDARFTDYKGTSTDVGLPVLKGYNADKREAELEKVREAKDDAMKDMNKPSQEILNKIYTDFKNGEMQETEYYNHLAELKKFQNEEDADEEVSENFIQYMIDNYDGVSDTIEDNAIAAQIQQTFKDEGKDVLRRADLVKAMNADNPSPTSNYLKDMGNKLKNAGRAISGSLAGVGLAYGTYYDGKHTDKTYGEAFANNATATGIGIGASAVTSAAIKGGAAVLGASTPVGWAILGGVAVGTVATWGFNYLYDNNVLGTQYFLDSAGQQIDKGWDWTTEKVSDGWNWAGDQLDKAGDALSSGLDAINLFS